MKNKSKNQLAAEKRWANKEYREKISKKQKEIWKTEIYLKNRIKSLTSKLSDDKNNEK